MWRVNHKRTDQVYKAQESEMNDLQHAIRIQEHEQFVSTQRLTQHLMFYGQVQRRAEELARQVFDQLNLSDYSDGGSWVPEARRIPQLKKYSID